MLRKKLVAAFFLTTAVAVGGLRAEDGLSGPYLAGRFAAAHYDYAASAQYYTRALIADPSSVGFLDNAILSHVAMGEFSRVDPLLKQMDGLGASSQMASLLHFSKRAASGEWSGLVSDISAGKTAGPLVDGLFKAWALVGDGKMSEATAAFDAAAGQDGLKAFALYQKALALAFVGDFEGADQIFAGKGGAPLALTRRGVIAHAQILSQLERSPDAVALLEQAFGKDPDPAIAELRRALQAGAPVPFDIVRSASDGIAEVLYSVAAALVQENPDVYTLGYARLAHYVRPDHFDAILLSADILEQQEQYDLASKAYDLIPADSAASVAAEIGRAGALIKAGKPDAAVEVLRQLGKAHPELATVWTTLGDTLRRTESYAEAEAAYDKAIASFASADGPQWVVYYARGIARERQKKWDSAVEDFRKALELSPDQPQVLNYLGYGFLEKGVNLDEALSMIQRAVAARPQDGYIVDSLGWALYRLGRYAEAVAPMEQAIGLMPSDPVVNDHLGDVYWAVGRKREAEFQWSRALSFGPDTEEEAARIRKKLEVGLDAVLKDEGAPPLSVSQNGD